MKLFFIPLLYSYKSRFKKPIKLISWFFIYLLPLFLVTAFSLQEFDDNLLISFLLVVLNIYNLYEIGYIYNDTTTILSEKKPTMRLSHQQIEFYLKYKNLIYIFRFVLSFLIFSVLWLQFSKVVDVYKVAVFSVLLLLVFYWYNSVRGRINLFLHFLLVVLRFSCVPIVFYSNYEYIELLIVTILLFPILNLVERAGETRFAYQFFQHRYFLNRDVFRSIYYFIGLIISILISNEFLSLSSLMFGYFFLFRFLSIQFISSKNI